MVLSKKQEKMEERVRKLGLKYYAIMCEFDGNRIIRYNVFDNTNIIHGVAKSLLEYKDYGEFKKEIDSWFMYSYWSKSEYEIVAGGLFVEMPDHLEKIDIYYQVEPNLDMICRYILTEYNKSARKKIEF